MPEAESLTTRAQSLANAVDRWNGWMLWALVLAAAAALAVVVTTRLVLVKAKQLSKVQDELLKTKDQQLAADLKEKDLKIADAGKKAAIATEQAKIADARAAEANKSAEKEKIARLVLEAKLAPRRITGTQRQAFSEVCGKLSGHSVEVNAMLGVSDADDLAEDIANVIAACGPNTILSKSVFMIPTFRGLIMYVGSARTTDANAISEALLSAGVTQDIVQQFPSEEADKLLVGVGAKPQ